MFATGVTMGLAEWIIDDTCLVVVVFKHFIEICTCLWGCHQTLLSFISLLVLFLLFIISYFSSNF